MKQVRIKLIIVSDILDNLPATTTSICPARHGIPHRPTCALIGVACYFSVRGIVEGSFEGFCIAFQSVPDEHELRGVHTLQSFRPVLDVVEEAH